MKKEPISTNLHNLSVIKNFDLGFSCSLVVPGPETLRALQFSYSIDRQSGVISWSMDPLWSFRRKPIEIDALRFQGYKMDDLLTSYISQMLTNMNKQRSGRGHSKWTSYWQEATELIRLLRPIGQHCSWGRSFGHQLWWMSRSPSAYSTGSDRTEDSSTASGDDPGDDPGEGPSHWYQYSCDDEDEPSSEDDYLWEPNAFNAPLPLPLDDQLPAVRNHLKYR